MSRARVKICGISSLKDLRVAVEAGADAVGFIVDIPQSPRNLPIEKAAELTKATPVFVDTVAVTVPRNVSHVEKICRMLNPDVVQIHGSDLFHKQIRERLADKRLICAVQAESDFMTNTAVEAAKTFDAILVDSHVRGKHGGTGITHDWELSRLVREAIHPKPLILAGGLTPENVERAIRVVKPYAVDVSSGVESRPGTKDRDRVWEFIRRAREVEA